jgi:hypothetical protein
VKGARTDTGADVEFTVLAKDEEIALRIANEHGIYVSEIVIAEIEEVLETSEPSPIASAIPTAPSSPKCPNCKSNRVVTSEKGFGYGKAALGFIVAGPVGFLAGGLGAKKIVRRCGKCGHVF